MINLANAFFAERTSNPLFPCFQLALLFAVAVGCDSAQQPATPRAQLGVGASSPPPPPPPAPATGSVADRPQADTETNPAPAEPTKAPSVATASPSPAPAEPAVDAEQQALIDEADPKNWRTDYYAFLKNAQPVDGQFTWGEMKEFARWFKLLQETSDAMADAGRARSSGNKQAANKYLKLQAEFRDAAKKLGKVAWSARVESNPRSSGSNVKLALPDLPAPANITFWIPKDEVDRWNSVQEGDTIRFEGSFNAAGSAESPGIMVYMHLLR